MNIMTIGAVLGQHPLVRIDLCKISCKEEVDDMVIHFMSNASMAFDIYDTEKLMNS